MVNTNKLSFDFKKAGAADLLPKGDYLIRLPVLTLAYSKDGGSSRLTGMALVVGGNHPEWVGKRFGISFTMEHPNEDAQRIGHRQLAQCMRAAGFADGCDDTDQLGGRQVWVTLDVREGKNGYEPSNTIKSFRPYEAPKQPSANAPTGGNPGDIPF